MSDIEVRNNFKELIRQEIPAEEIVRTIRRGMKASIPVYNEHGQKVASRPDWKARKPFVEMATEFGGFYERKEAQGASIIAVTVTHVGGVPPTPRELTVQNNAGIESLVRASAQAEPTT